MTVQRLSHLGICVTDLDRSLAFYRDGLGFREVSALDVSGREASTLLEIPGVRLRAIYLERDGARIELLHYPNTAPTSDAPLPMNRPGLTHLSFRVSDLDAALKAIQSAGGSILPHTRIDTPRFHAHAAFALDPDGTRIELVQSPGNPDTLPGQ